ncbi:MAG: RagB/SusD family nutrient uptake outer membrane protein [Prolixibacteraceae bacterium]|nr:RagB/SusD family nutrient uptake outer membrane protein [Prolixibacteraceae bacterium]MBN2772668.1 RagB/SusD family nutrient uptake outer membrane protein [Prolixibacteraceae bacterium]
MKRIYILSFIALLLIGITGCNEDFLDVQPTQFLTDRQIAEASENNPDVIAGSMSGIYTLMFQTGTGGTTGHDDFGQKGYDIFSDFLSSDLALSVSTYGWYRRLTEYTVTTDYTQNGNYMVWRYYYRLIRSANNVINALGGNDAVPELEENKYIMGQAKAMRAYCYFYLSQFYATSYDPAAEILPIYTDPTQPNQPKSTTQAVFDLIISDLTDAITLLDNFNRSAKNEVNKYVAEGLLAYTYAVMGGNDNFNAAKSLTNDIINNGGFTLMSADEVVFTGDGNIGGFNDVNTPGWMWGVDITLDNGLDLVSWWGQMDQYTYSYQWAGDRKACDEGLFNLIPEDDVRKGQFYPTSTSSYYLTPYNKFYHPERVRGRQRNITTDYVYMRVAEMYLLNAEVSAKSGDETTAKSRLKALVSQRVPDASYIDALSGQALQDEIYLQTRIELWGEGKSYLAMKRNHATIVRGDNHLSYVGVPVTYDDPRLTFEIPQSEIQNNPFIN